MLHSLSTVVWGNLDGNASKQIWHKRLVHGLTRELTVGLKAILLKASSLHPAQATKSHLGADQ